MLKELLGRCGTEGNDEGIEGDLVDEVECDGTDDLKRDSKDGDRDLEDNGEDDDIEGGGEESEDDDRKYTVVIYSRAKAKGIIKVRTLTVPRVLLLLLSSNEAGISSGSRVITEHNYHCH